MSEHLITGIERLSKEQRNLCAELCAGGPSNKELAERHATTEQTMKNKFKKMFDIVGVESRLQLAMRYMVWAQTLS